MQTNFSLNNSEKVERCNSHRYNKRHTN